MSRNFAISMFSVGIQANKKVIKPLSTSGSFGKKKSVFILTVLSWRAHPTRHKGANLLYKGVSGKFLPYEALDTDASASNCITVYESCTNKKIPYE